MHVRHMQTSVIAAAPTTRVNLNFSPEKVATILQGMSAGVEYNLQGEPARGEETRLSRAQVLAYQDEQGLTGKRFDARQNHDHFTISAALNDNILLYVDSAALQTLG